MISWPADKSANTADAACTARSAVGVHEALMWKKYCSLLVRLCISTARSSTSFVWEPSSATRGGVGEVSLCLSRPDLRQSLHFQCTGSLGSISERSDQVRCKVATEDSKFRPWYL